MKAMIRKVSDYYEIYLAKQDLEGKIVEMENPTLWGGWVKIENGMKFLLPDLPADTKLPLTVDARKLGDDD
jgi:nitrogen fixation protein NifT